MPDQVTLDMSTAQPLQAPIKLDMSTAEPINRPSASSRFGSGLLSGLGITTNEEAKQFFTHPIKTFMDSIEAQGKLAQQAKDAYEKGDYAGAVQHGLNYLLPFIGQQTDQAGNQLKTGDIAGGIGRTLGASIPLAAASPEVRAGAASAASSAADTGAAAIRAGARGANTVLQKAPGSIGGAVGAGLGRASGIPGATEVGAAAGYAIGKEVLPQVRIPGEGTGLPNRVTGGPSSIPPEAIPEPAAPQPTPADAPRTTSGESIPRTLSGESALRQVLTGQDNANLMKIAKSRGINVAQEAQLKPGIADNRLITKIIDDFSDDELDGIRSQYMETKNNMHQWGDIGAEAWKTKSLQTYFPDVKIPQTVLNRTAKISAKLPETPADLTNLLQQSLDAVKSKAATR